MKKIMLLAVSILSLSQNVFATDGWNCSDSEGHSKFCYTTACMGNWLYEHRNHTDASCDVGSDDDMVEQFINN